MYARSRSSTNALHHVLTVLVLAIAFQNVSSVVDVETKLNAVDSLIHQAMAKLEMPGMAVGFVANGEIILSKGYGLRNYNDSRTQVTPQTVFPIGSCTKAFTAYVLARLVEEGTVAWDDPVNKYIPEFQLDNERATKQATIKDLVTHATGLPSHDVLWIDGTKLTAKEYLERIPHLQTAFDLRESFQYNNIMYAVLAQVIEKASNRPWNESLRHLVFDPLNMTRSFSTMEVAHKSLDWDDNDIAAPHMRNSRGACVPAVTDIRPVEAAASIVSTIEDLTKWIRLQLSGTVPKQMHTVQMPFDGISGAESATTTGYGLGWIISEHRGRRTVAHGGLTVGFRSTIVLFPEEKEGIVVLMNTDYDHESAVIEELAYRIVDIFANRSLSFTDDEWISSVMRRAVQIRAVKKVNGCGHEKRVDRPMQYLGQYVNAAYGELNIGLDHSLGQLFVVHGSGHYILEPKEGPDFFRACREPALIAMYTNRFECSFVRDSTGHIYGSSFRFEPLVAPIFFEKKPERNLLESQYLKPFVGVYKNILKSIEIVFDEEKRALVVNGVGKFPATLIPYKRNWFQLKHLLFEFVNGTLYSELIVHEGELMNILKKEGIGSSTTYFSPLTEYT